MDFILALLIQYDFFFLSNFKLTISFPINFKKKPIGVTIIKKIENITTGGIILANISANFIHVIYKGDNNFEFKKPKIKNTPEIQRRIIEGF